MVTLEIFWNNYLPVIPFLLFGIITSTLIFLSLGLIGNRCSVPASRILVPAPKVVSDHDRNMDGTSWNYFDRIK